MERSTNGSRALHEITSEKQWNSSTIEVHCDRNEEREDGSAKGE